MGTRGVWGFYKDGINKLTYNHFDSYPDCLGRDIINFINNTSLDDLNKIFNKIILVDEESVPTYEQIEECKLFADTTVSKQSLTDWYCLLKDTQGNPELYKKDNLHHMINYNDFIKDSLFCEWAYVINLTDNILEIYKGFQETPNSKSNRYRIVKPNRSYYACEKTIDFPLDNIPLDWLNLTSKKY